MIDYITSAKEVFDIEIESLIDTKNSIGEDFIIFVDKIRTCSGRIIITGMGKSGHISRKIAATMQSLGIKSYYMHPGEALHGDLGLLTPEDLVLAISNSGETEEILNLIPAINKIGTDLISIIGRSNSTLQKYSSCTMVLPLIKEAHLGSLVPSSSTTASLVLGDALAIVVSKINGFTADDFGIFHPNGLIGKKLTLKVRDLMLKDDENSVLESGSTVKQAVFEMCNKSIGGVSIVDRECQIIGVFTDGDFRRLMNNSTADVLNYIIDDVMTTEPLSVNPDILVSDVVEIVKNEERKLSFFPVVEDGILIGSLRIADVISSGLMG